MASSNKTAKLKLSQWAETDRPERMDFVQDNQILETILSTHLDSPILHLTEKQKTYLGEPYRLMSYAGNGQGRQIFMTNYPAKAVLLIAQNKAPFYQRDGYMDVYWTAWSENWGGTGCPVLVGGSNTLTVTQQTAEQVQEGVRYCLNESGVRYAAWLFR